MKINDRDTNRFCNEARRNAIKVVLKSKQTYTYFPESNLSASRRSIIRLTSDRLSRKLCYRLCSWHRAKSNTIYPANDALAERPFAERLITIVTSTSSPRDARFTRNKTLTKHVTTENEFPFSTLIRNSRRQRRLKTPGSYFASFANRDSNENMHF